MPAPGGRKTAARAATLLGELLLTAGLVTLLYCGYALFWTNERAARAAAVEVDRLEDQAPGAGAGSGTGEGARPAPGTAFAVLRIPRLGRSWVQPVLEGSRPGRLGVTTQDLARGVVHYPTTGLPGELGNFALAGHRATNGEPFRDLDRLVAGDEILVETPGRRLRYVVSGSDVIAPTRVDVLEPVPSRPGARPEQAVMTLTTCHPRWGSTSRLVVFARLAA